MTASEVIDAKASYESSQEEQVRTMESQCYQILLIGEDFSLTQIYAQMLQDAEDPSFVVEKETSWQSALARLALGAPDLP